MQPKKAEYVSDGEKRYCLVHFNCDDHSLNVFWYNGDMTDEICCLRKLSFFFLRLLAWFLLPSVAASLSTLVEAD